jgi:serine/threonine protein kinase
VRRFLAERQILSGLEHPNIARLIDGGATEDGRPFLVMECVEGEPITDWADRRRLTVRERLRLFLQAADAVQFAHRRLVIHRDIKPSNILVDETGTVKLLDFGIAKLLDMTADDDLGAITRTGARPLFTPAFASPEQVREQRVTTASDVYQLGALLYLLLAGRRPFHGDGTELEVAITTGRLRRPSEATVTEVAPPAPAASSAPARRRTVCAARCAAISMPSSCSRCGPSRSDATPRPPTWPKMSRVISPASRCLHDRTRSRIAASGSRHDIRRWSQQCAAPSSWRPVT